jgi:DNA-binding transcriptional regulator YhcF (GntR family)
MTKSSLLEVIGDSPRARVLDFLLTYAGFDYSKTQVAREAGVSRVTIDAIWRNLEKQGYIKQTRSIANAQLYALNTQNPQVKALVQLEMALAKAKSEKAMERQTAKART